MWRNKIILLLVFISAHGCSLHAPVSRTPSASAIASAHPLATAAGFDTLTRGGNAFDAAISVAAALAVVEPMSSGLGGGGFWLLHRAKDGKQVMIDGRERAPQAASATMYQDEQGQLIPRASLDGALAAAIPGIPAALVHLAQNYGRLALNQSLAPAIALAREGFAVTPRLLLFLKFRRSALNAAARQILLTDGELPSLHSKIIQLDLAHTLERLASKGRAGFYAGEVAKRLVTAVQSAGGIWTADDLATYRIVEREPVVVKYQGARLVSAALPSSGGLVMTEILNMLSEIITDQAKPAPHQLIEVMRRAYRDRALYMGDPDHVAIPPWLTDPAHARRLMGDYDPDRATVSTEITPRQPTGTNTTHYSILDREGNRVAATLSINYPFGSAMVAEGSGVILNNEMDDFSSKPGTANAYGLVGSQANAIAAGKRPLSSMSPSFIEIDDAVAILGTPGGSRIISMVMLAALEFIHGERDAARLVSLPRYHHQYLPDRVVYEQGAFSSGQLHKLAQKGHRLAPSKQPYGNMQAIIWRKDVNQINAASDPRGEGRADIKH